MSVLLYIIAASCLISLGFLCGAWWAVRSAVDSAEKCQRCTRVVTVWGKSE